jgi:hypothetical protein
MLVQNLTKPSQDNGRTYKNNLFFVYTILLFDQYSNIGVNKIGIMNNSLSEVFGSDSK